MPMEQNTTQSPLHEEGGNSSGNGRNSVHGQDEPNEFNGFECNICLDPVQEPVVTFCGHLYCWPCIYQWIQNPNHHKPPCPVCKTEVSQSTLIPLYGRGQLATTTANDKLPLHIPQRPRQRVGDALPSSSCPALASQLYNVGSYMAYSPMVDPMIGMLGEMIFAGMFRNSGTTRFYGYPRSYRVADSSSSSSSSSPRMRRHMMQIDESLSRVCFFLCCCAIMCLLLF